MATGVSVSGVTTIRWGTANWNGASTTATNYAVVTRASQRVMVSNDKLPQGSGLTSTRILTKDGVVWDVTIRDDTRFNPSALAIGTKVYVYDYAGMFSDSPDGFMYNNGSDPGNPPGGNYMARIVENGYEVSPKNPGERTISLENLVLIEGAGA